MSIETKRLVCGRGRGAGVKHVNVKASKGHMLRIKYIHIYIYIYINFQVCTCHLGEEPKQSDWAIISQRTARLGGSISLKFRCSGCSQTFDFNSDSSQSLKERVVTSFLVAGISHGKYQRFGSALGNSISCLL